MSKEKEHPQDLMICVGRSYYTKDEFIKEALTIGCCRRVSKVPEIEIGKTRCFLAMLNEENILEVFGCFIVKGIGYVVGKDVNVPEEPAKKGVKPIGVSAQQSMPVRGCGMMVFGAIYLLSEEDFNRCRDLADKSDLEGNLMLIDPPCPTILSHFRGYKYVDGDRFLEGRQIVKPPKITKRWKAEYQTLE